MRKICILLFSFSFAITAISQKKLNPTIGKKEFEISISFFNEHNSAGYSLQNLLGAQIVYRWSWKKYTKVGLGGLAGVQNYDPLYEADFVPYGALFGDITQFFGKRQKWSAGGQMGHGIFKREQKGHNSYYNYTKVVKQTAGIYYSISLNYRPIISKKILMIASMVYTFRNFHQKNTTEYSSPPSVEEYKSIQKYSGPGIRLGIVF